MPTLDAEPEAKMEKENEKSTDGGNGKVINKDVKTEKETEKSEKVDSKEGDEMDEKVEEIEPRWVETADGQIEVEDPDDYLIYLEDILKRIHR